MPKGKVPGSGWFDPAAYAQHVAYPMNPVRSAVELKLLIEEMHAALPKLNVPVLLIHSRDDDYVVKDSMQQIYKPWAHPISRCFGWKAAGMSSPKNRRVRRSLRPRPILFNASAGPHEH